MKFIKLRTDVQLRDISVCTIKGSRICIHVWISIIRYSDRIMEVRVSQFTHVFHLNSSITCRKCVRIQGEGKRNRLATQILGCVTLIERYFARRYDNVQAPSRVICGQVYQWNQIRVCNESGYIMLRSGSGTYPSTRNDSLEAVQLSPLEPTPKRPDELFARPPRAFSGRNLFRVTIIPSCGPFRTN